MVRNSRAVVSHPQSGDRFNGAAPVMVRNSSGWGKGGRVYIVLQWGRTIHGAEFYGSASLLHQAMRLQWGRTSDGAEFSNWIFMVPSTLKLQWGRTITGAEFLGGLRAGALSNHASMGPHHHWCGISGFRNAFHHNGLVRRFREVLSAGLLRCMCPDPSVR